jgi:hypothetical protein
MASTELTNADKEKIAITAVKEVFEASLLEMWKNVTERITDLVKDMFKDSDWEHVGRYVEYTLWRCTVELYDVSEEVRIRWDTFRVQCGFPGLLHIPVSFSYPTGTSQTSCLAHEKQERVKDTVRPYMKRFLVAEGCYEDIRRVSSGADTYEQFEIAIRALIFCVKSLLRQEEMRNG